MSEETSEEDETIKFEPKSLAIKTLICVSVLLVGAAVFMALEREKGDATTEKSDATKLKEGLVEKYNISLKDLRQLESAFEQEASDKAEADRLSRWTYSNSVFFAFTIMTTIGYGHMSPHTWQGQLFCIFFSLVGIPVAGIMLISVGNHVSLAIRVFIRFMEKTRCLRGWVKGSAEMKSTVVTFVFMILMIIFGAILTSHTDRWSFIEGSYFTFISVSTIGFGDYVVNDGELKSTDHGKTFAVNFTIVLITLGLCVVSSVLCSVSALIEERQKRMRIELPGSATNALNAANLALNTVTSNLPLRLSAKVKGKHAGNVSPEQRKENGELERQSVG